MGSIHRCINFQRQMCMTNTFVKCISFSNVMGFSFNNGFHATQRRHQNDINDRSGIVDKNHN